MLDALEWSPPKECRNRYSFTESLHLISKIHCGAVSFIIVSAHSVIYHSHQISITLAMTRDFEQCGILTCVDSDEHVQPPFTLTLSLGASNDVPSVA